MTQNIIEKLHTSIARVVEEKRYFFDNMLICFLAEKMKQLLSVEV